MRLRVEGLVRTHPGAARAVLDGLSFELPGGTLLALLGPSGAGKSTFLRCLIGLEPFERGVIDVEGVLLRGTEEATPRQRADAIRQIRERIGLVFQAFELFPHLTALENCVLPQVKVKRIGRKLAELKAADILTRLGLGDRLQAHPDRLSGGQRQRVAIGRALAMEPSVLLYDEPTSALDPSMKQEVLQTLQRVDATGVTQVVVTHDLALARGTEHVCVMDHGQIIEQGPPGKLLSTPEHESTRRLLADWR